MRELRPPPQSNTWRGGQAASHVTGLTCMLQHWPACTMADRPVGGLGTCSARAKRGRSDTDAETAHDPLHQAKRFRKVQEVRSRSTGEGTLALPDVSFLLPQRRSVSAPVPLLPPTDASCSQVMADGLSRLNIVHASAQASGGEGVSASTPPTDMAASLTQALTIWQPSTRVGSTPADGEDEEMKTEAPQLRLAVLATALAALAPPPAVAPSSQVTRDGAACRALVLYAPPPTTRVPRPLPPPRPPSPAAEPDPSSAPPRLRTWAGGDAAMMEGEWDGDDAGSQLSEGSIMALD